MNGNTYTQCQAELDRQAAYEKAKRKMAHIESREKMNRSGYMAPYAMERIRVERELEATLKAINKRLYTYSGKLDWGKAEHLVHGMCSGIVQPDSHKKGICSKMAEAVKNHDISMLMETLDTNSAADTFLDNACTQRAYISLMDMLFAVA